MPRFVVALAGVAALVAAMLAGASTAWAHAVLEGSSPTDGAVLAELPTAVTLQFDEVVGKPADLTVIDPSGNEVPGGDFTIVDHILQKPLAAQTDAMQGTYTVSYQVTSLDTHLVSGSIEFSVGRPGPPAGIAGTPVLKGDVTTVLMLVALLVWSLGIGVFVIRRLARAAASDPGVKA
jgi:methionine-rich copper-binding protein CopC